MYVIHKQSTKFMFTALLTLRDIEVSGHNTDLGFKELSPCSHLAGKDPVIPQVWDLSVGGFFCFLSWGLLAGSAKKPPHSRPESRLKSPNWWLWLL